MSSSLSAFLDPCALTVAALRRGRVAGPVGAGARGVGAVETDALIAAVCAAVEDRMAREFGGAGGCTTG
jgi:hypothetical protein